MSQVEAEPVIWTATVEDLYRVEGKAELLDGRIVHMSPTGLGPGRRALNIVRSLADFADKHGGDALGDNVGFLCDLPHRRSFSPDASYYTGPVPDDEMKFLPQAPVFATEVRSKEDYGRHAERKMADKRTDYFASGTQVVWDVDPLAETVTVFRATQPDQPTVFHVGEIAEAEPAVPGWTMAVADVFKKRGPK